MLKLRSDQQAEPLTINIEKEMEEMRSGCRRLGNCYRAPPENERRNPFPRAPEVRRQPSTGWTAVASLRQAEASMPSNQTRTSVMNRCFQLMTRNAPAESVVYFYFKQRVLQSPNGRRDTIASPGCFPGRKRQSFSTIFRQPHHGLQLRVS